MNGVTVFLEKTFERLGDSECDIALANSVDGGSLVAAAVARVENDFFSSGIRCREEGAKCEGGREVAHVFSVKGAARFGEKKSGLARGGLPDR